jgi:large subunit ribosomal protein L35|tara:strand:- start:1790 stop:1987 length:198 start_codon:yes stop_codon:yes gene_type:complete
MPKLKTNSSAKKRFGFTSSGKIKRNYAFKRHNLRKRSQSMKRKARGTNILEKSDYSLIKNLLPYK